MSTCQHGSTAPDDTLRAIHESQAGIRDGVLVWRHRCCECAFVRGEALARNQDRLYGDALCKTSGLRAPSDLLETLPISQAGGDVSRHKCALCSLHEGFNLGRRRAENRANR
jgi:hypothetical protein